MQLERAKLETQLVELGEQLVEYRRYNKFRYYKPYPKQYEFHATGGKTRERLFRANNQGGKTYCGGMEAAYHLTGWYPEWWPGVRYDRPVFGWGGAVTAEKIRETVQFQLLGVESVDINHPDMGTGAIPKDAIKRVTRRQGAVGEVFDTIQVRHVSGGISTFSSKTYDMDASKWTGKRIDFAWLDEEAAPKQYTETVTRTQTVVDGTVYSTLTNMSGSNAVMERFVDPGPDDPPRSMIIMSIYDCIGGIWPEGTPWAGEVWTGHYTKDSANEAVAAFPAHEREARAYGALMMGEGKVFPVAEDAFVCTPFDIPPHYRRVCGIDFGYNHPGAACWIAYNPDTDVAYIYDSYKESEQTPVYHVMAIRGRGTWIPVAWPHDGLNTEKDGTPIKEKYEEAGLDQLLPMSARYDLGKGGRQDVEPGVINILERMITGRLKIFATETQLLEEIRFYHRKEPKMGGTPKIVDRRDDIISAMRYAFMMLWAAEPKLQLEPKKKKAIRIVG